MRVGPLTFLFAVAGTWAVTRAILIWPEPRAAPAREIDWADRLSRATRSPPFVSNTVEIRAFTWQSASRLRSTRAKVSVPDRHSISQPALPGESRGAARHVAATPVWPVAVSNGAPADDRWSLSAWALVRGEGAPGLAAGGQLAGSQAGLRLRYRLGTGLHLAARISGPVQSSRGKEAAFALDMQPLKAVPITLIVERRVGLDGGGRDAFATGLFGGFDARLAQRVSVNLYGQAGLVGLRRRDPYADGALRIESEVGTRGNARFGVGAGAWGGAQPGASRLDLGPQLVAHIPVANGGVRIGAEWRQRVAGQARPGSGPVLSLGADF